MDRSLQAGGRNLSLSRQFPGLLLYLSPGRDHYKLMVLMTELLLWCLTMSREILEAPNSFLQFQFNNISYPKSFVSILCREFRWKFCILTYFALYFLQKWLKTTVHTFWNIWFWILVKQRTQISTFTSP